MEGSHDNGDLTRVTLIQCTNAKREGRHKARDLYDESAYYCIMREWAESLGNPWFILSAKYGLLNPMRRVDSYNEKGITIEQSEQIARQLKSESVDEVVITAGKQYTDPLTPELECVGIDVIEVCRGMRIGERMAELKERTKNA